MNMARLQAAQGAGADAKTPGLAALGLAALGVVFGDIGTSPLYTFKTVLELAGDKPDATIALGALSLIVWTLIIVTSVKYVTVAMSVDNNGEGGILALMALLGVKHGYRPTIVAIGLLGAALIYGDGAVTPAISVLSALEGLNMVAPSFQPYVLPATVAILVGLFAIQSQGTALIGKLFGPVMVLWFASIAALGVWGILRHPGVLAALDPRYGLHILFSGTGFLVLGGVFLSVTGAEALYADMGHFGPRPIRYAWTILVLPALVLNYAGQSALVVAGEPISDNVFYQLCPGGLLVPMVILSTIATIIASQSIITGAFSMTRQAIRLGWLPRLPITQTSAEGYGQIYVGPINWLLMLVTVGLAVGFGKSDNLAAAYGIAVSTTMLLTSLLLFIAMREIWGWSILAAGAVAGGFVIVDGAFVAANMTKLIEGGYVPLALAVIVYGIMQIWHRGVKAVNAKVQESTMPMEQFLDEITSRKVARVPGTAVFLTRTARDAPPVMVWHVKQNRSLHERLFVLTVMTESVPWIVPSERLTMTEMAPHVWRAVARFGFMERIDIPAILHEARAGGCRLDFEDVTYYVGHETIMPRRDKGALPRWIEAIFAYLQRNSEHVSDYLKLPSESVVEIGRHIPI